MSKQTVICLTRSEQQAELIVERLRNSGFLLDDISVLFPDQTGVRDLAYEKHTKAPEKATAGAGTGAVIGGTLGLLAGIGTLAIPGLGAFIAAGPIMAALSGAAIGGTVGGVTGALIGLGIPEYEAKQYEGKIRQGNLLISVHVDNSKEKDSATRIFKDSDATDISCTNEIEASSKR